MVFGARENYVPSAVKLIEIDKKHKYVRLGAVWPVVSECGPARRQDHALRPSVGECDGVEGQRFLISELATLLVCGEQGERMLQFMTPSK